jgi:aldehyde:ferredoxin oxidoreductase
MGSKKLKAIAVSQGTRKVSVQNTQALKRVITLWREKLPQAYFYTSKNGGITRKYLKVAERGIVAWKNMSCPGEMLKYGQNMVDTAKASKVTPRYCRNCPIGCAYDIVIGSGVHRGYTASLTGGGEGTEGAAALIGVEDGGTAYYLTDLYDRLGFDSSEAGSCISLAFECYNRGIISKEDTGGLELQWGNWKAAVALLTMMIRREGFGKILAEGPQRAAELIGGEAPKFVLHIKGTGYNIHDWRPYWQKLFAQIVATAGPCHHGTGVDGLTPEPDLGYPQLQKSFFLEGIIDGVKKTQIKKIWTDCLGICDFVAIGLPEFAKFSAQALSAITGWDFTREEGEAVGERVINLEKLFSLRRGFTIDDDLNVGHRTIEAPEEGPAKGRSFAPNLKDLISEYYHAMGWNSKGEPKEETLIRLELEQEGRRTE